MYGASPPFLHLLSLIAYPKSPVEDRFRRLRAAAAEALQNFLMHQEGQVSRIPKLIRDVALADFADRFGGDVSAALRGLQAERIKAANPAAGERSPKKRKWLEDAEGAGTESSRAAKNRAYSCLVSRDLRNVEVVVTQLGWLLLPRRKYLAPLCVVVLWLQ